MTIPHAIIGNNHFPLLHGWRKLEPRGLTRYTCFRIRSNSLAPQAYPSQGTPSDILNIYI